jgi:hypothetical protein
VTTARRHAAWATALGWDQGPQPMDLEKDLFATFTLVTKPRSVGPPDPH